MGSTKSKPEKSPAYAFQPRKSPSPPPPPYSAVDPNYNINLLKAAAAKKAIDDTLDEPLKRGWYLCVFLMAHRREIIIETVDNHARVNAVIGDYRRNWFEAVFRDNSGNQCSNLGMIARSLKRTIDIWVSAGPGTQEDRCIIMDGRFIEACKRQLKT